jgi:uncharacterized protein YciI
VPEPLQLLHYDYVPDIVERRVPHREAHLALAGREDPYVAAELVTAWRVEPWNVVV